MTLSDLETRDAKNIFSGGSPYARSCRLIHYDQSWNGDTYGDIYDLGLRA